MNRPHLGRPPGRGSGFAALAGLLAVGLACGADPPAAPFCETLQGLRAGRIDVGSGERNEMIGHVRSLEALLAVAPREVAADLETLRDVLADVRDAGGLRTLLAFTALEDPELANVQGRITEFVAEKCGVRIGEPGYHADTDVRGKTPCPGWGRAGSPLTNNRFPYWIATAGANYFALQLWAMPLVPAPEGFLRVERGGRVELRGEYPFARYFAFHPNDMNLDNLDTLVDVDLEPDPGSVNPWRAEAGPGDGRRFTANLVFSEAPERAAPNTVHVGERAGGGFNPFVYLLYRIYAADQGALPPNSAGVRLPEITVYGANGEVDAQFEACDPYPAGFEPAVDETRFPVFPVPDHRAVFQPGQFNTESNFGLPIDIMANRDVLYLIAPYAKQHGEVFAVRAGAPRTPSRARGIPLDANDTDLRLWTLCTYNFWNGRAIDCRIDENVVQDAEGRYLIVVSAEADRPANATPEDGVTWLDAGEFLDGQLTYRMLLASDPFLQELDRAIDGGEVSPRIRPYVPRSAHCAKAVFEAGGFDACAADWEGRRR